MLGSQRWDKCYIWQPFKNAYNTYTDLLLKSHGSFKRWLKQSVSLRWAQAQRIHLPRKSSLSGSSSKSSISNSCPGCS